MVVTFRFPVVATRTVAKVDLMHQACFFQETQGVINSCVTNRRQALTRGLENLVRSQVFLPFQDDLEHRISLRSQLLLRLPVFVLLAWSQDRLRLILNYGIVNRAV